MMDHFVLRGLEMVLDGSVATGAGLLGLWVLLLGWLLVVGWFYFNEGTMMGVYEYEIMIMFGGSFGWGLISGGCMMNCVVMWVEI
jgi:hypothetical protein